MLGLDPSGDYFVERWDHALQSGDANKVVRFNTNMKTSNGSLSVWPLDINVNGGQKQPNCKINVNKCSHYEAWSAFSRFLKNKADDINGTTNLDMIVASSRIHPYVICLDVSESMRNENRLTRAVKSARESIIDLSSDSFVGIVTFNGTSKKAHDIIQLKGSKHRESLLASLPTKAWGGTSIGNGLRLSLNMLQAMQNSTSLCSTIVLISDGEETKKEFAKDVLPDLIKGCVKVNTIALGKNASIDLELLSNKTGDTKTTQFLDVCSLK